MAIDEVDRSRGRPRELGLRLAPSAERQSERWPMSDRFDLEDASSIEIRAIINELVDEGREASRNGAHERHPRVMPSRIQGYARPLHGG